MHIVISPFITQPKNNINPFPQRPRKKPHDPADTQHCYEGSFPYADNPVNGDEGKRGGKGYKGEVKNYFDVVQFPARLFLNCQHQAFCGLGQQIRSQVEDYADGDNDHARNHEQDTNPVDFWRGKGKDTVAEGNKQT